MKQVYVGPYRKLGRMVKGYRRKGRPLGKRTMKVTRKKFIQLVKRDKSGQILGTELKPIK